MSDETSPPRLSLRASAYEDLTLAFDAFHRIGASEQDVVRLAGRRFVRCNLTGPALVTLGARVRFADCVFSACAFTAMGGDVAPAPGSLLLEDCSFDDCVLTRWSVFLPPDLTVSLVHDMPQLRVFGLPPFG
jgi:hypothetical protein